MSVCPSVYLSLRPVRFLIFGVAVGGVSRREGESVCSSLELVLVVLYWSANKTDIQTCRAFFFLNYCDRIEWSREEVKRRDLA